MDSVAFWAQWITLALIIAVPFAIVGHRPNFWTWLGASIYVLSYLLANAFLVSFWVYEAPTAYRFALRLYQLHSLILTALFCAVMLYRLTATQYPVVLLQRSWRRPALLTFKPLPEADLQAKLVWLILTMAETFAVLEYIGCSLFKDPVTKEGFILEIAWGHQAAKYACERAFGPLSPYVAPITTTLFLLRVLPAWWWDARQSQR